MTRFMVLQIQGPVQRTDAESLLETTVKVRPTTDAVRAAWHMYSKACYIMADEMDDVFRIGNIGPEDCIERIGYMHSISVGDVIINTHDKRMFYVDSLGFKQLPMAMVQHKWLKSAEGV